MTSSVAKDVAAIQQRSNRVRAAFVAQGLSLNAWCLAEGVKPTNAYKALAGKWTGPKATALIERLEHAAGVEGQPCE